MQFSNLSDVVTVKELANFLKVSDQTILRAIRRGELVAFKVSRDWRLEKQEVVKWLKNK